MQLDTHTRKWIIAIINDVISNITADALSEVSTIHRDRKLSIARIAIEIKGVIENESKKTD
jgi:hypothetical protein